MEWLWSLEMPTLRRRSSCSPQEPTALENFVDKVAMPILAVLCAVALLTMLYFLAQICTSASRASLPPLLCFFVLLF